MVPKKGLSGEPGGYKEFWIHRFLCKKTGKTVSIHPRFSHTGKRYTLAFVVECLQTIIKLGNRISAAAQRYGIYRTTLRRWFHGFSKYDINAKWACFFHGDLPREATAGFAPALLNRFRTIGNGNLEDGTSLAMVRLHEGFSCRLY